MSFRVSPCIGLVTPHLDKASRFYRDRMKMSLESVEEGMEFVAGPMHIFLDPGPKGEAVFELLAPDLDAARGRLRFYGYEEIVWNGIGKANLVRDPFGLVFNVFEYGEDEVIDLNAELQTMYRPIMGAVCPSPAPVAEFYSMVLQRPANRLADGSYIVSGGDVSLRFRAGAAAGPVVWLAHDAPVENLIEGGCEAVEEDASVLIDPFGLRWAVEPRPESTHALVNPL